MKFEEKLIKFKEILTEFNKIHNLTNYESFDFAIKDSLDGAEFITNEPKIAIDIGSGAGFPGLILAMKFSQTKWHLFEPLYKKSSFLTYAKIALNLENTIIHHEKLENSTKFIANLITSRAVMKTKKLLEISDGFYDKNTEFLFYKGSSVESELDGLKAQIFKKGSRNFLKLRGSDVR